LALITLIDDGRLLPRRPATLLLGEFTRLPLGLVGRPQDAGRLLHDAHQQVVDVVLQLPDVGVLPLHHLLLLDEVLHHLVEGQVAVGQGALLLGLLQTGRRGAPVRRCSPPAAGGSVRSVNTCVAVPTPSQKLIRRVGLARHRPPGVCLFSPPLTKAN